MKNKLFVLFFIITCGCSYHSESETPKKPMTYSETSYRSPNSIGLLRRLVMMPLVHEPFDGEYESSIDQKNAALKFRNACVDYLMNKKGYEIVAVEDNDGKWESEGKENLDDESLKDLYQMWLREAAGKHTQPVIQKIGRSFKADGVLVVWVKELKPWGTMAGLLNITLLNAPLFYNIASSNIGAWIYESSSGQLVWSEERSTFGMQEAVITPDIATVVSLFADMENAVPHQLTK